jgi:hypothetical protein
LPSVTVKSNEVAIHEPDQEVELSFHNLPLDQEAGGTESEMDSAYTASYLENVVASHYAYISSQDYESAYDLFSSNRKQKVNDGKWASGLANNYDNEVDSLSVDSFDNNRAIVSFHLTSYDSENGHTLKHEWGGTWKMVKEGDEWKLDSPNIKKLSSEVE